MRSATILAVLMALTVLSGCAETPEAETQETTDTTSDDPTTGETGNTTAGEDAQDTAATVTGLAFRADVLNGTTPLLVNFTIDGDGPNATWDLDFGDGNMTNGTGVPATANHTYHVGAFNATLTVGSMVEVISINVTEPAPVVEERPLPEQTRWEFGPSAGCAGDTGQCISLAAGPDQPAVDGFWAEMTELHWGLSFGGSAANVRGDSDCWFIGADGETKVGNANNSDKACGGIVPEGAAWIFVYSYAEPAEGLVIQFDV